MHIFIGTQLKFVEHKFTKNVLYFSTFVGINYIYFQTWDSRSLLIHIRKKGYCSNSYLFSKMSSGRHAVLHCLSAASSLLKYSFSANSIWWKFLFVIYFHELIKSYQLNHYNDWIILTTCILYGYKINPYITIWIRILRRYIVFKLHYITFEHLWLIIKFSTRIE